MSFQSIGVKSEHHLRDCRRYRHGLSFGERSVVILVQCDSNRSALRDAAIQVSNGIHLTTHNPRHMIRLDRLNRIVLRFEIESRLEQNMYLLPLHPHINRSANSTGHTHVSVWLGIGFRILT